MRNKLNLIWLCSALTFLLMTNALFSQRTIGPPELASGGTQACARPTFNSFDVIAVLGPGSALPSNNEFILELSDPSGSFASGVIELARASGPNNGTGSQQDIEFNGFPIPEDANSDFYRLRVRSSEVPEIVSTISEEIAFHFFDDDLQVILNDRNDVFVCSGSSINETISVTMRDGNNNSVDPNNYNWEWLRNGAVISGADQPSLQITQEGTYSARVPLGKCQFFYAAVGAGRSNNVDVLLITPGSVTISTPAADFSFCPDEEKILISSETSTDFDYQWFKDGVAIQDETNFQITLPQSNFQGDYEVEVAYSPNCSVTSPPVTLTNEGSSITEALPPQLILLPGEVITLQVSTDAPNGSVYRWRVGGTAVSQGVISTPTLTYETTFVDTHRFEVDANDPCNSELFTETDILSPIGFEIEIGVVGSDVCDQDSITIELIEIRGLTNQGDRVPLTDQQLDFFTFEWFRDGVALGETNLSLLVDSDEEGSYELRADLISGGFTGLVSNNLPVNFLENDISLIVEPAALPADGSPVTITSPFNVNFNYQWFSLVNGEEELIVGETSNTLSTTLEGIYFVRITTPFCQVDSLTVTLGALVGFSAVIPNVITPDNDSVNDNWVLPSEIANQQDVEVIIYDSRGQIDFSSFNYSNDWPSQNSVSQGNNPTYYYIITKNSTVLRKGSITVMK